MHLHTLLPDAKTCSCLSPPPPSRSSFSRSFPFLLTIMHRNSELDENFWKLKMNQLIYLNWNFLIKILIEIFTCSLKNYSHLSSNLKTRSNFDNLENSSSKSDMIYFAAITRIRGVTNDCIFNRAMRRFEATRGIILVCMHLAAIRYLIRFPYLRFHTICCEIIWYGYSTNETRRTYRIIHANQIFFPSCAFCCTKNSTQLSESN